ncbi:nickel-dependent hydrogenase large subunit, partial [Salmonella enterica subsp. enterica serovar Anatum]|nr:nickel-dependent hydrogenase large subunit [Salmonella enterica subsp. enterica serovar Anatum]
NNKMLQRIYGTAWADKKALNAYLQRLEEAAKRDHRKIGKQLDQFCEQVYLPDVLLIASYYKDWAKIGGGLSSMNLLAYGEFPDN